MKHTKLNQEERYLNKIALANVTPAQARGKYQKAHGMPPSEFTQAESERAGIHEKRDVEAAEAYRLSQIKQRS